MMRATVMANVRPWSDRVVNRRHSVRNVAVGNRGDGRSWRRKVVRSRKRRMRTVGEGGRENSVKLVAGTALFGCWARFAHPWSRSDFFGRTTLRFFGDGLGAAAFLLARPRLCTGLLLRDELLLAPDVFCNRCFRRAAFASWLAFPLRRALAGGPAFASVAATTSFGDFDVDLQSGQFSQQLDAVCRSARRLREAQLTSSFTLAGLARRFAGLTFFTRLLRVAGKSEIRRRDQADGC